MAGQNDRDGVAVHDRPDGARGPRLARLRGERAVGRDLSERDAPELLEHRAAEVAGEPQVDLELELLALAREVLVELAASRVDGARRAEDARAEAACEPFDLGVGIRLVGDDAEAALRDADEELAEWRLHDVVGDVEQACFGGRRAETAVELREDVGHDSLLLSLSRRTPEEAAWRAASSEEPSAAAISS